MKSFQHNLLFVFGCWICFREVFGVLGRFLGSQAIALLLLQRFDPYWILDSKLLPETSTTSRKFEDYLKVVWKTTFKLCLVEFLTEV